ncbi:MAG: PpiC domain-containing protein [Burkholderia sp.]|jgi:peptidyl-prolyl cis-trans isomerase C
MEKKLLAIGLTALMAAGAANAALTSFKVNGETVSVAEQQAIYNRAVASGQQAGPELERQVKNLLIQRTVLLQEAKKAGVEKRADVQNAIKNAHDEILVNALLADYASKNPVSEADLRKAYDNEKLAYGDTEYQIRLIIVKTEDEAKKLITRASKRNADFAQLASENSIDARSKANGGLMGWVVPRMTPPALGATFAALKKGEVAQTPVRLENGFAVVKLDDKRAAQFPTYEKRKPMLKRILENQRVNQHYAEIVRQAKVQ